MDIKIKERELQQRLSGASLPQFGVFHSFNLQFFAFFFFLFAFFFFFPLCVGEHNLVAAVAPRSLTTPMSPPGLSYPVFKGIMKKGYKVPTPIQRKVRSRRQWVGAAVTVVPGPSCHLAGPVQCG